MRHIAVASFLPVLLLPSSIHAQEYPLESNVSSLDAIIAAYYDQELPDLASANGVIDALYSSVTFNAGEEPDWELVKSFFLPEALVVFAPRRRGSAQVMDLEGWVQDFVDFYNDRELATKGFHETIAEREVSEYGNIAHAFVVFEPRVGPDWDGPTTPGVDSIELVRHDGRWWIAAITTQFSSTELPIPTWLRGGR